MICSLCKEEVMLISWPQHKLEHEVERLRKENRKLRKENKELSLRVRPEPMYDD